MVSNVFGQRFRLREKTRNCPTFKFVRALDALRQISPGGVCGDDSIGQRLNALPLERRFSIVGAAVKRAFEMDREAAGLV